MTNTPTTEASTEALRARLATLRRIQLVIGLLFGAILVVWLVTGLWRENFLLFTSTMGGGIAILAAQTAGQSGLVAELRRRGG
jgi:hypothetical protein